EEASSRRLFHTHVERSATDLELFRELQRRGELTVRVYAFLTLPLWREVLAAGIRPRSDEGLIRFGALKAFIDGFLMDEPYADDPDYSGSFTFRFVDERTMAADIAGADAGGFDPVIHTIGAKEHGLLLDAGARLDIVSDWPGSFNERRPTPLAPLENIALAVMRGWHPEQRLTVEEALIAYTVNPAFASYEEDRKGTITEGKLADLVVL